MSNPKLFKLSKEHALVMLDTDDPSNLNSSSLGASKGNLGKRSFAEYDLSVIQMSSKDKVRKKKGQLAILSNQEQSEGRYSTARATKKYAIALFDEKKNVVEIVKMPYWFVMKKQQSMAESSGPASNKLLQMEDIDQAKRRELMIKEIGTAKSRKMLDKLKNKSIEVLFYACITRGIQDLEHPGDHPLDRTEGRLDSRGAGAVKGPKAEQPAAALEANPATFQFLGQDGPEHLQNGKPDVRSRLHRHKQSPKRNERARRGQR